MRKQKKPKIILSLLIMLCMISVSVTEVKAATYGTDAFGSAYSKGYIRNRTSSNVIRTSGVTVKLSQEINEGLTAESDFYNRSLYTGSNTSKSAYIDYKRAARYVDDNGDPVWLDMRVYIWADNVARPWTLNTNNLGVIHLFNNTVQKTNLEFHFYQDKTLETSNPVEVDFKGVVRISDLDASEGVLFYSGYNKFYRTDPTYVKRVKVGDANSNNPNNPFSQDTSKKASHIYFFGTVTDSSVNTDVTENNKQSVWVEVNSTSSKPFKYQYATREGRRGSSMYYQGTAIEYYVDNVKKDTYYCVPYGQYSLMKPSKIEGQKTGYTIDGWYTANNYTTKASGGTAGTDTIKVYGRYKANTYMQTVYVRYQNADGTWGNYGTVINQNYTYGSTVSWSREADAVYKAASISYTVTQANTKYVDVYRNTYTVTLNKGTGIASVTGAGTYYYGQSVTINATLSTGYHWINWTGSATSTAQSYVVTVNGNKTFTANAAINTSTLKVNPNGGIWNGFTATQSYTQNYNTTKSIPVPTRTGYTFTGWTRTNTYGSMTSLTAAATYTFGATNNVTDTLTAKWKPNIYYVSYYKGITNNGGTTSKTTHTYDADVTLASNGFTGTSYSLTFNENKPKDDYGSVTAGTVINLQSTKSGSLPFKNWYITNAHNNNNTPASGNINLGKKNYRNDNGGTATATAQWNSVTLNNYSSASLIGYKFNGYYTAASGGAKVTTITVNPSTTAYSNTLYAQWTPITYKVRFNGNGNWNTSQGSYTQQFTYDKHIALQDNKFTRADATTYNNVFYKKGYEFIGWGTSPNQKISTYSNKQTVSNLTATDGAVIDLYALWKKPITLTINFNGGKFNNSSASKALSYTMYNSELNHTFDIKQYYGTLKGTNYNSKGLNNNLTKTDSTGIQYRFLGYSLNPNATVPDTQFDVYSSSRTENYTIKDNTTIYAVWEPVLQMTAQITAPTHTLEIQLDRDVPITTAIGNFTILNGTKSTDLPSNATASANTATIGATVINKDSITYTVSAKGTSNIKFTTAADSRIIDIYNNGKNDTWFDELNTVSDFNYTVSDFSSVTGSFTIPQYLGTTRSYQTSNPNSSTNTTVYGLKFTCSQESYYYRKYWNTTESTSVYCILFLDADNPSGGNNPDGTPILPPSAVKDGYYEFETILN